MSDPRELVLEMALRTALEAPLDDLSARVSARWRSETAVPAVETRVPRRSFPRLAGGALAASAALAVLWLVRTSSERPAALLATSDVPVTASEPGEWRPIATTRPWAGATVGAEQPTALTLAGGARLELAAGSVIRLELAADAPSAAVPGVRLLAGDVTLTGSFACALLVGDARVVLAPGACLRALTHRFDDPHLFPPSTRPFLARNLHMNRIAPATAALFTLLSGAAVLTDAAGSCALPANTPVASSAQESPDPVREMMAREVGTWDLSITDYLDGKAQPSRTGTEVCTLPSTGEWLLSDWTMQRPPGPPIWMHVVLGYSPGTRRWHGSLVDSFGGRMALLEGEAGEEPTVRVLSEGFEHEPYGRTTTRWVGDDERITTFEAKQGDEWVRTCEIVHRRRGPK